MNKIFIVNQITLIKNVSHNFSTKQLIIYFIIIKSLKKCENYKLRKSDVNKVLPIQANP